MNENQQKKTKARVKFFMNFITKSESPHIIIVFKTYLLITANKTKQEESI